MKGSSEQIAEDLQRYRSLGVTTMLLETRTRDLEDLVGIYERFSRDVRPRV